MDSKSCMYLSNGRSRLSKKTNCKFIHLLARQLRSISARKHFH